MPSASARRRAYHSTSWNEPAHITDTRSCHSAARHRAARADGGNQCWPSVEPASSGGVQWFMMELCTPHRYPPEIGGCSLDDHPLTAAAPALPPAAVQVAAAPALAAPSPVTTEVASAPAAFTPAPVFAPTVAQATVAPVHIAPAPALGPVPVSVVTNVANPPPALPPIDPRREARLGPVNWGKNISGESATVIKTVLPAARSIMRN
ncbi:hypothetical protein B0H14DRAFT_3854451 [Mycena olivaceomarginata]|nr:hypothetical protein B0H14DRAFT_3854451 [Mycena olivaceomarginata]